MQVVGGEKIRLIVETFDQQGKRYEPGTLVQRHYLQLAESGFKKAGYTLAAEADKEVRISLKGQTPKGIVNNESNLARNMATGVVTAGIACKEMQHDVDAAGEVSLLRGGQSVRSTQIDMKTTETSCFSHLNPSWVAKHQEAAVRTYEHAVEQHVGAVLQFVSMTK